MKKCFFVICIISISFLFTNNPAHSLVMTERFEYNTRHWPILDDETIKTEIVDEVYIIENKLDEGGRYIYNSVEIDTSRDYVIEVVLNHLSGHEDYGFGLIWDMKDGSNYHAFDITDNGYYRIAKMENDEWSNLTSWTALEQINTSGGSNTLVVRKHGNEYYFIINNSIIDMHELEPFWGDKVGFMVYMKQKIGVDKLDIIYVDPDKNIDKLEEFKRLTQPQDAFLDAMEDWF